MIFIPGPTSCSVSLPLALGYEPETSVLVGVGTNHEEVNVMRETWPDISVFGYEANPKTYHMVKDVFPGSIRNLAITNRRGPVCIYVSPRHIDGSSLYKKVEGDPGGADSVVGGIETKRLDDDLSIRGLKKCLLWIDCEGSELEALYSGTEFIKESVDVINVEMTGRPWRVGFPTPKKVDETLKWLGFTQVWTHTIRPTNGQYDAVYLKDELVDDTMRCCF